MDKAVCVRVRACVCVPGCVGLSRGRGDVEFLQSTAVSPGRGGEGACWRGNATAGTLREDGLFIRGKEGEGAVDRESERERERESYEREDCENGAFQSSRTQYDFVWRSKSTRWRAH